MNLYHCFTGVHCWIVGKPVSSTLDADRPRKTGSRYNDTLNGARKPKGCVTMSRKLAVLIHCLVGDFWQKLHWGVKIPPVAGTRVKIRAYGSKNIIRMIRMLELCCDPSCLLVNYLRQRRLCFWFSLFVCLSVR